MAARGQKIPTWWSSMVRAALLEEVPYRDQETATVRYYALKAKEGLRWMKLSILNLASSPELYVQDYAQRRITGFVEVRQKWWSFQPGHWITHHAFIIIEVDNGSFYIACEKVNDELELMFGVGASARGFMKEYRAQGQPRSVERCLEMPRVPVAPEVTVRRLLEWMEGPLMRRWKPYSLLHSNCQHLAGDIQRFLLDPDELERKLGDPACVLDSVRDDPKCLKSAPWELQASYPFVMEAVKRNWRALLYAPPELQRSRALALVAVSQDGFALQNLAPPLRADRLVVLAAVQQKGLALQFASNDLRSSREVVMAALAQDGEALQFAGEPLRRDRATVLSAVRQAGLALRYASGRGRGDREVVLEAVRQNGAALQYAMQDLRQDGGVLLAAGWSDPLALKYAFV